MRFACGASLLAGALQAKLWGSAATPPRAAALTQHVCVCVPRLISHNQQGSYVQLRSGIVQRPCAQLLAGSRSTPRHVAAPGMCVCGPVTQPGGHQEVLPTTSGSDHARGGGCSGLWRRTADRVLSCCYCQWVCRGGASPQVCCFLGGEHGVLDLPAWSLPRMMDWCSSRPVLMSGGAGVG
jgi:hypothetical protein